MLNIETVKQYLKIDTDEENEYLKILINATDTFIQTSCNEKVEKTELYTNAQLMLIGMLYSNRGITDGVENKTLINIYNSIMLKIKNNSLGGVENAANTNI